MPSNTSRMGYTYPLGTDPTDVEGAIQLLATQLDAGANGATAAAGYASGLSSGGLPVLPPGVPGRIYFATDTSSIYFDTGAAWINFGVSTPIGGIVAYGGSPAPANYLLCDGSSYSRTTYAGLYSIIGLAYGSSGSTTFNVPDLRSSAVLGAGTKPGFSTRNLGDTGGQESVTLSVNQMPSHGHGISDPSHAHPAYTAGDPSQGFAFASRSPTYSVTQPGNVNAQKIQFSGIGPSASIQPSTTGVSVTNTGGSTATPVLPPYTVAAYIIRYQ
jgi:microcystin-dependent protein